jgi:hypothetical protein
MYDVLECFHRETPFGPVLLVRIHRKDKAVMGWPELAGLVQELYPTRRAVQTIPLKHHTIDQANKYHVWVLPEGAGACFDLFGQ